MAFGQRLAYRTNCRDSARFFVEAIGVDAALIGVRGSPTGQVVFSGDAGAVEFEP